MNVPCFLIVPTGRHWRFLRRYISGSKCPGPVGYHDARAFLDVVQGEEPVSRSKFADGPWPWPRDDSRWPAACGCGVAFTDADEGQLFCQHEYRRVDTGELGTLSSFPPGAMWWADWMAGHNASPKHKVRGDGAHLIVKTPGGDWDIDSPSSNQNGEGWDRTGDPPNITARPSIAIGEPQRYHGFLTDGVLVEC